MLLGKTRRRNGNAPEQRSEIDAAAFRGDNAHMRLLSTGFFVCGLVLLGLGAYAYVASAESGPSVAIDETKRHFATFAAGSKRQVTFRLENSGSREARVVGLAPC